MVRIAKIEDLPAIAKAENGVWSTLPLPGRFNAEKFRERLAGLMGVGRCLIVADFANDGEVLSALGVAVGPEFSTDEIIAQSLFFTANPNRKSASAFKLVREVEKALKKVGVHTFQLTHLCDEKASRMERAFKRFGFAPAEVKYTKKI